MWQDLGKRRIKVNPSVKFTFDFSALFAHQNQCAPFPKIVSRLQTEA